MKHPASTAAFVLLGLAFLVGGATWLLAGSEGDAGQAAQMPELVSSNQVGFVPISPKEQHKKQNMERAQRELKRIREVGTELSPDFYMIPDANGDPTYYSTQLVKGVGRNGEPLYASLQMKRTRTLPLRDRSKYTAPGEISVKMKPTKGVLKGGKANKEKSGAEDDASGHGGKVETGSATSGTGSQAASSGGKTNKDG